MARKRSRRKVEEHEAYDGEIIDWEVGYSISGDDPFDTGRPFQEYSDLTLKVRLLWPEKHAGTEIEVRLLGDRRMDREMASSRPSGAPPYSIGTLTIRGSRQRDFLGSIPTSAIFGLLPSLESGRLKFVHLHGQKLYRGSASISYLQLCRSLEEE